MGKVLGNFGLGKIEGSSTSNSRAAAIQLLKALKSDKSICFTPDGPTGPAMEMTLSPLVFAQKSGKPVIGMVYSVSRAFISRKSWDDMMIPLPFSRGVLNCTKPFFIPKDASAEELEKHRLEIEKALVEASVGADKAGLSQPQGQEKEDLPLPDNARKKITARSVNVYQHLQHADSPPLPGRDKKIHQKTPGKRQRRHEAF